jgi:hypothetical protein
MIELAKSITTDAGVTSLYAAKSYIDQEIWDRDAEAIKAHQISMDLDKPI